MTYQNNINLIKRITAGIVVVAFIFTQSGIGLAMPDKLRKISEGKKIDVLAEAIENDIKTAGASGKQAGFQLASAPAAAVGANVIGVLEPFKPAVEAVREMMARPQKTTVAITGSAIGKDFEKEIVELFGAGTEGNRQAEIDLEEFLVTGGEKAIAEFVRLIEKDRGESIGPWRIPAKDFTDSDVLSKLPKPGLLLCVSVEKDDDGKPIPYYMPDTTEGIKEYFEKERVIRMAQVAIQKALGRKVVVDVGVGFVGTIELLVASSVEKDLPKKDYGRRLRFRPPISRKAQNPVMGVGYEPLGSGTYRQDMMDRGMVGLRMDDPTARPIATAGHDRGNLAATFMPEILSVCDFALVSIPQHPFRENPGHPENIFADPGPGLGVVEMVAKLLPENALCIVESTVFPTYMELFAIPTFEKALKERNIPQDRQPMLGYSFQRMEPGPRGLASNREQVRMGGANSQRGLAALAEYFEFMGYSYSVTNKIIAVEDTKDSENAERYQVIASTAPMQAIFEELGFDIYKVSQEIVCNMISERIPQAERQEMLMESVRSLKNAYETAREYAQWLPKEEGEAFLKSVLSVFSQSTSAVLTQAILYPGGYCVIEQIGHLIYGMLASGMVTELDIKVIFQSALQTIAYMKMRQRDLADWIVSELVERGIDPRDASIWTGGVTYMPQIEDARNGSFEYLMRVLADMGITDFTVFEPYAQRWDQVQRQDAFSPESEAYGLVNQTWLRGVNYIFGQQLVEKGKVATEDKYEHTDPHKSFKPRQDVLILSMDHPQLVGHHQPELRRTDGRGIVHHGLDAVKVAARAMVREGKIILDTHFFLADEDIKEFLALGWQVRSLGRGIVDGLKKEVEENVGYRLQVIRRLLVELEVLRGEDGIDNQELEDAIKTTQAKIDFLQSVVKVLKAKTPKTKEQAKKERSKAQRQYTRSRNRQERAYSKSILTGDKQHALEQVVKTEVDPAVDRLQANVEESAFLANSLASQLEHDRGVRSDNPEETLRHINRLEHLIRLVSDLLADSGLAADELFTSKGRKALSEDPRLAGLFPQVQTAAVEEGPARLSESELTELYVKVTKQQHRGINRAFQHESDYTGTHMGNAEQASSKAGLVLHDRPTSHAPVAEQEAATADPQLVEATETLADTFRRHGLESGNFSRLETRATLFSYEANSRSTTSGPVEAAHRIVTELSVLGIAPQQARIYLSGRIGSRADRHDQAAIEQMTKALQAVGCNNIATATREGELPTGGATADQNVIILTGPAQFTRSMNVTDLAARMMGREGNLIYDANNALTNGQIMELLALGWSVAGLGRSDIYGLDGKDINGDSRHLPGLIDDITEQHRLDAARRLLKKLQTMQDQKNIDKGRLAAAMTTISSKISYLESKMAFAGSPFNFRLSGRLRREEGIYIGVRREQENSYELPLSKRDIQTAHSAIEQSIVAPLEKRLSDLLRKSAAVSSALADHLAAGRCRAPETTRDLQGQLRRLNYLIYVFDDVMVDCGRAVDTILDEKGQIGARNELDRLKQNAKGDRLVLPEGHAPQYYEEQLHNAPMTPDLINREIQRLAQAEKEKGVQGLPFRDMVHPDTEPINEQEALRSLQNRFYNRFTAAGDALVLPAVKLHPGPDGKHIEVTTDPEVNLTFTSLRFMGDAAKGKHENPSEWIKYTLLVPLYVADVTSEIPGETRPRDFDYFVTQEFLRSDIPWETKQWIIDEVLSKGKVLTTIRTQGSERCDKLSVLMQGNPYADVGSPKDTGGSGRAGFLVSMESGKPRVIVTTDEFGREKLLEAKGIGPMFGPRDQDSIMKMERNIAGGQRRDATGRIRVGMITLSQLYGLVRGPQYDQLLKAYGLELFKEEGGPSGIAGGVFFTLPWAPPDTLVGIVFRTTPSSWRMGFQLLGDDLDYDAENLAYQLGLGTAEMLAFHGDSENVHIAHGLDNNRLVAIRTIPRTTKESEITVAASGGQNIVKGYPTDEDSLVDVASERDMFAAFDYYFDWTLTFVLFDYSSAKGGRLDNPDYTYLPQWVDGFVDRMTDSPAIRKNKRAVARFRQLKDKCHEIEKIEDIDARKDAYEGFLTELRTEVRDRYAAHRAIALRMQYGYDAKADSTYTSNAGKNFRHLTAKGPSRETGSGKIKASAHDEALEFLAAEERLLNAAISASREAGYPVLRFNFQAAFREIAEKRQIVESIAEEERRVVMQLGRVMGLGDLPYEEVYQRLLSSDEKVPNLGILEYIPSYEQVYELKYYAPRAKLVYAKVASSTYIGPKGRHRIRMGTGTVQATRGWDKQAAKMAAAQAELGKAKKAQPSAVQEQSRGLQTLEVEGTKGPMAALLKEKVGSQTVVIFQHGLAGSAADHVAGWIADEVSDRASFVAYTTSRERPLGVGEELNPGVFDEVFGQKGTVDAKTFMDEAEDLRRVISATIRYFVGEGVPEDKLSIVLAGRSLGGQIVSIVAGDFPQVKGVVDMTGSPQTFSGSGLPQEEWHELVKPPSREEMGRLFGRFTGCTSIVLAEKDLAQRNASAKSWVGDTNPAAPEVKIVMVPGKHGLEPVTEPSIRKVISDMVDKIAVAASASGQTATAGARGTNFTSAASIGDCWKVAQARQEAHAPLGQVAQIEPEEVINPSRINLDEEITHKKPLFVILAAGQARRHGGPKCVVRVGKNKTPVAMIPISQAKKAGLGPTIVVVGGKWQEAVMKRLGAEQLYVTQSIPRGTAHALFKVFTIKQIKENNPLMVACMGDRPGILEGLIKELTAEHNRGEKEAAFTFLTTTCEGEQNLNKGRIVRDKNNKVLKIMEQSEIDALGDWDAVDEETGYTRAQLHNIKETNCPAYVVRADLALQLLSEIINDNPKLEYFVTKMVELAVGRGLDVRTVTKKPQDEGYPLLSLDVTSPDDEEKISRTLDTMQLTIPQGSNATGAAAAGGTAHLAGALGVKETRWLHVRQEGKWVQSYRTEDKVFEFENGVRVGGIDVIFGDADSLPDAPANQTTIKFSGISSLREAIDERLFFWSYTEGALRALQRVNLEGKSVLVAGTGIGTLAFVAARLGAKRVVGIEKNVEINRRRTDVYSVENPDVKVTFIEGDFRDISLDGIDVVIADVGGFAKDDVDGLVANFNPSMIILAGGREGEDREQALSDLARNRFLITEEIAYHYDGPLGMIEGGAQRPSVYCPVLIAQSKETIAAATGIPASGPPSYMHGSTRIWNVQENKWTSSVGKTAGAAGGGVVSAAVGMLNVAPARALMNALNNWKATPEMSQRLIQQYGPDEEDVQLLVDRCKLSLESAVESGFASWDEDAEIVVVPGRAKFGNANDYAGAKFPALVMATKEYNIYILSRRSDNNIRIGSANPERYPEQTIPVDRPGIRPKDKDGHYIKISSKSEWVDYITHLPWEQRPMPEETKGNKDPYWWGIPLAAITWLNGYLFDKDITIPALNFYSGFSGLPAGGGLSSSSSLAIATIMGLNNLFNLGLTDAEEIFSGYCEYEATLVQGDIADHASIVLSNRGEMGLLELTPQPHIDRAVKVPEGLRIVGVETTVNRQRVAPYVSSLIAENTDNPDDPESFRNSLDQLSSLGPLGGKLGLLYFKYYLREKDIEFDNLSDLVGVGKSADKISEAEILEVLNQIPERQAAQDIIDQIDQFLEAGGLQEYSQERGVSQDNPYARLIPDEVLPGLRKLVDNNAVVPLRALIAFFVAGGAKVNELYMAIETNDMPHILDSVRSLHNGDRTTINGRLTKDTEGFYALKENLWQCAGMRARSVDPIDWFIDTVEEKLNGKVAGMIMGAGFGGQVVFFFNESEVPMTTFNQIVAETLKQMITDHVFIPLVENKAFQQPAFVYAKDITKDEQKASEVVQISQAGDLQRACEKLLEGFSPQITEYQPGQGASVIQIPANVQLAEQAQPAGAGSQPTVTAAASSGLDVSAPAAGDIFNFIKDNLTISADDMGGIIERFHADMKRGLAGEESSLKMLIGYVDKPTGDETGEFMGFDFGGSNFRVLSVKLLGNGNIAEPVKMKKYPMEVEEDGRHLTLPADELFDFVAGSVADFLHAQGSVSGEGTIHSGFTFSFPISQTGIDEGRVGELTKGFANDGLLGANPVTLLRDAILRNSEVTQSGTNVQVDALCNDTIGTLVARAYSDPHCDVGVILGTGTNGAFFADLNSVPLYRGGPTHSGKMAINMEWGGFDKLRRTPYDVQLDNNSNNPGRQILEKMVSGKYLGENARLTLVDLIAAKELLQGLNGNVPPALKERYAFTVEGMAKIESDNSPDLDQVNVVLQGFGVENSTPNDRKLIKDVCAIVSTRAARVSASVTAGTIKWMDPEVTRLHTVAVDGSLFAEYPGFKERMETALGEIFKDRKQQISLVYAPDGSGKGAAVIAAVVASQQISTTSSAAAPQPGEGVTATVPHVTDREEQMIREAEESLGLGPYAVEMQMQVGFMQEVLERTDGKAVVTEKKAEGALREADICAHMMRELTNAGLSVVQGEQQGQRPPIYVFAPSLAILSKDPAFGNAYVIATENDRPAFDEMGFTNVTYGETLADARDNLIIKLQEEGLISEGAIRHIRYYFGEDEENIPSRLTSTFVMDLFQLILDPSGLNDLSNPDNNLRITVKDTEAFKSAIEAYRQLFNDL